jgi:hypothetical protein
MVCKHSWMCGWIYACSYSLSIYLKELAPKFVDHIVDDMKDLVIEFVESSFRYS